MNTRLFKWAYFYADHIGGRISQQWERLTDWLDSALDCWGDDDDPTSQSPTKGATA